MEPLPTRREVADDIGSASTSAEEARRLRVALRRRTKKRDPERRKKIEARLSSLEGNGSILRSHLRRSESHERPYTPAVRRALHTRLARLRYERRQLKKMLA